MKFFKGIVVGTLVSTGVMMMMSDSMGAMNLRKQGKKLVRKIEKMM